METWFRLPEVVRVAVNVLGWFGYAVRAGSYSGEDHQFIACAGAAATLVLDHRVHTKYGSIEELKAIARRCEPANCRMHRSIVAALAAGKQFVECDRIPWPPFVFVDVSA